MRGCRLTRARPFETNRTDTNLHPVRTYCLLRADTELDCRRTSCAGKVVVCGGPKCVASCVPSMFLIVYGSRKLWKEAMKVDIDVISDAVNTLKTASDMASSAKAIEDLAALKKKLADMSGLILAAHSAVVSTQAQLMGMMQENFDLQSKLSKVEQWEDTASRYLLKDFGGNTYAYELKAELADNEAHHLICPNCFQTERKSILQFSHDTPTHQRLFKCRACSEEFALGFRSEPNYRRSSPSGLVV